ncbi:bifunctional TH2 protein, mitochondrial [Morus notabilis]|uniref:bifunctional TH2 protein, mitochondrial n=1 Tax=Morus notabilis TaxID=981085 RepID=UPI000CED2370|nr:bifunctional TH2 protein, mitochondrial [Morus notabilis]
MERLRAAAMREEKIPRRWWRRFESESPFAQYSSFFISLTAGTLAPQAFSYFISQDLHIWETFKDAYASAAENCLYNAGEKMIICHLRESLLKKINERQKIVQEIVQELGSNLPKQHTSCVTIIKYTDFLLDTISGKAELIQVTWKRMIAAHTLCAIIPCMRLYYHLLRKIKDILDPSDTIHPYKKLIDHYSSQDFEVLVTQTEDVLEKLSNRFTRDEIEVMERLYFRAVKLHVEFFAKLPTYKQTLVSLSRLQGLRNSKLTIFCEYDRTCTIDGSTSAITLANLSITIGRVRGRSSAVLKGAWDCLANNFNEEFEQCLKKIKSITEPGQQKFDCGRLWSVFPQVAEYEKHVIEEVVEWRLLRGLSGEEIESAASTVILRDGCRRSVFGGTLLETSRHVCSNELPFEYDWTSGDVVRMVETSFDKVSCFFEVLKRHKTETEHLTVCIGGDVCDLLCLLAADIGIVICPTQYLEILANHFGIKFVPLFTELVKRQKELNKGNYQKWKPYSGNFYTVSCWAEIEAFILGL